MVASSAAPTPAAVTIIRVKRIAERSRVNGAWRHRPARCARCLEVQATHIVTKFLPDAEGQPIHVLVDAGCLTEVEGIALQRGTFYRVDSVAK